MGIRVLSTSLATSSLLSSDGSVEEIDVTTVAVDTDSVELETDGHV